MRPSDSQPPPRNGPGKPQFGGGMGPSGPSGPSGGGRGMSSGPGMGNNFGGMPFSKPLERPLK